MSISVFLNELSRLASLSDKILQTNSILLLEGRVGIVFSPNPSSPIYSEVQNFGELSLMTFYLHAQMLKDGPKIYQPSREVCDSMSMTQPQINWEDYKQPFDCLCIEYPRGHIKHMGEEVWGSIVLQHPVGILVASLIGEKFMMEPVLRSRGNTVEESLQHLQFLKKTETVELEEIAMETVSLCRLALNCAYLLTHFGWKRQPSPADKHIAKLENHMKKFRREGNSQKAEAISRQIRVVPIRYSLEQEQLVRADVDKTPSPHPHSKTMVPFWRMGHFRMQAYGEKFSLRKRIFIRPVLVNSHLLKEGERLSTVYRNQNS